MPRHRRSGPTPARNVPPPKPKPPQSVLVRFDEIEYELLTDVCEMLGIDEEEAMKRALALLANEISRQAILMPADDDDDDDDDDEDEDDD